jgi:hypothetical protein
MSKRTVARKSLTSAEKDDFFEKHLPHRLTLLRAFRYRESWGGDWQGKGDIFRCLEESALMSIRLFIEALGIQGMKDGSSCTVAPRQCWQADDVWIEDLGGDRVTANDICKMPAIERETLGALWFLANKELAHLTSEFASLHQDKHVMIRGGIEIVESLLTTKLYAKVGRPFPDITLS